MNGEFENINVSDTTTTNALSVAGGLGAIDEGGCGSLTNLQLSTREDVIYPALGQSSLYTKGSKLIAVYNDNNTYRYTVIADLASGSTTAP